MPETVVADRMIESNTSVLQLKVLAARKRGNAATQGEELNMANNEMAMVLSENFEWLWLCVPCLNLPTMTKVIPSTIKIIPARGSAMVSAYLVM
ncbi:MAG: hypothetical protein UZ01_00654 [Candidatus Brocadia sinica]|nr:MAG: hypothetical protein UZ01_00654 [Candidatus Brocadia sinica]